MARLVIVDRISGASRLAPDSLDETETAWCLGLPFIMAVDGAILESLQDVPILECLVTETIRDLDADADIRAACRCSDIDTKAVTRKVGLGIDSIRDRLVRWS